MFNFLSLLSLFTKVSSFIAEADTVLTASQKLVSTVSATAVAVATATGNHETAAHIQVVSDAVNKDAVLAESFVHLFQLGANSVSSTATVVASPTVTVTDKIDAIASAVTSVALGSDGS